ncbi:putative dioxygenase [Colletotrichum sublineola]|uniref:Putative dioxygenase n=1 Tax=Colletotrichum sublineola TaxID=1173701 RepID=A0A066XB80_COLSU|nr:putative dioxygenase [Colletotrichum sublineola]
MSSNTRNETQPLCGILGLESLVDEITSKQLQLKTASSLEISPTSSAILGPFYHDDSLILSTAAPSSSLLIPPNTRKPPSPLRPRPRTTRLARQGCHDRHLAHSAKRHARAAARKPAGHGPQGTFPDRRREPVLFAHCLKAVPYPILNDLFDKKSKYLKDDSALAVKEDLIVEHKPRVSEPKARWTLEYDFALCGA